MNLNQSRLKHKLYTHTNGNKHKYIYIYIYIRQILKTHIHTQTEKITISEIRNHSKTPTQCIKYQK